MQPLIVVKHGSVTFVWFLSLSIDEVDMFVQCSLKLALQVDTHLQNGQLPNLWFYKI